MTESKREMARRQAEYIASLIDWEDVLPRANRGLIPGKDTPITREIWIEMCVKSILKTGSPVKVGSHGEDTKMAGFMSVSTSSKANWGCDAMSKINGCICKGCYTHGYLGMRPELRYAVVYNYILLTQVVLEDWMIPKIRNVFGRIESWGDLEMPQYGGIIQARNYVRIVKANWRTQWGWWTKHPQIMQKGIDAEGGKPKNLQCQFSALMVNKAVDLVSVKAKYPCIDRVFNVFEWQFAAKNNVVINCQKHCWECGICYTENAVTAVYEEKK